MYTCNSHNGFNEPNLQINNLNSYFTLCDSDLNQIWGRIVEVRHSSFSLPYSPLMTMVICAKTLVAMSNERQI